MSVRRLGLVLAAVCAALLVVPVAAGAQTTPSAGIPTTSFSHIPMSSTAKNGKAFTGHFDVSQFITKGSKTYALGTLTGRIGNRVVSRKNVAIPVSMGSASSTSGILGNSTAHAVTPPATCPVLNLVLGPLHLNLLGLQVDLNQVVLNITAVPGAGNLLGNLLCSVANLLNGSGTGAALPASQLAGLLNILQQLLQVPGLASL